MVPVIGETGLVTVRRGVWPLVPVTGETGGCSETGLKKNQMSGSIKNGGYVLINLYCRVLWNY